MKKIVATPRLIVISLFGIFFIANTVLFLLRSFGEGWWLGDFTIYEGVDQWVHIKAYASFVFYWFVYFSLSCVFFWRSGEYINRKNLGFVFLIVVCLFAFQIYSAYSLGLGVASSVGSVQSPIYYLLFIFSFDAFYYVYAISEKNSSRYFFATALFIASNIVRGWAGFVIPLFLVVFIRKRSISRRAFIAIALLFVLTVPLLLLLREHFRGGNSYLEVLESKGSSGMDLYLEYFLHVLASMLSRLDFYSNYIGVADISVALSYVEVCVPIQENIFHKFLILSGLSIECSSLGSVLPSFLYNFFSGKGTSFSIGSGFMALPEADLFLYFISYFIVLLTTSMFVWRVRAMEVKVIFIYLVAFILFQGWMYQFVYNFLGLCIALFLIRVRLFVKRTANPIDKLECR